MTEARNLTSDFCKITEQARVAHQATVLQRLTFTAFVVLMCEDLN